MDKKKYKITVVAKVSMTFNAETESIDDAYKLIKEIDFMTATPCEKSTGTVWFEKIKIESLENLNQLK